MSMPRIFAGRRRRLIGLLVANGIAQAAAGFALALSLRELLREAELGVLPWPWFFAMVLLGSAVLGLRVREANDAERLGQDYTTRIRLRVFDRVALRSTRAGGSRRFGVTLTRLTGDLNSLRNWVSVGIARSIVAGVSIAGLWAGLFHFSPMASLVMAGVMVACAGTALLATPILRGAVREARRRRGRLANNLSEKVFAARAVWQLGGADRERNRIRRQSEKLREALVRRARWSALLRSLAELAWPVAIVGVLASLVATGRPTSELVVSILLVGMIVTAMGQIARGLDHRIAFEEGRRRIAATLSEPRIREARDARSLPGDGPLTLELDGVAVAGAFAPLRLRAEAGERILVVGPTASGKSTLLALAARLRDPDAGEVRLDGIPIEKIALDALHAAVQLVSSDLPLLRGTIGENVGYAASDDDPEWLERVAEACGLMNDPALGEAGLETPVEELGANLPHGLRQRVLVARAIAIRPRLLLVDEPGLLADPAASAALERALALSGATALIVGAEWASHPRVDRIWHMPGEPFERIIAPNPAPDGIHLN